VVFPSKFGADQGPGIWVLRPGPDWKVRITYRQICVQINNYPGKTLVFKRGDEEGRSILIAVARDGSGLPLASQESGDRRRTQKLPQWFDPTFLVPVGNQVISPCLPGKVDKACLRPLCGDEHDLLPCRSFDLHSGVPPFNP
jgi:hypothetical protein